MKCPHCLTDFHDSQKVIPLGKDIDGVWAIVHRVCPACNRAILELFNSEAIQMNHNNNQYYLINEKSVGLVRPKASNRPPPSPEVGAEFSNDYIEACLVLADSPKASAALSRRCLQHLLREKAKVKKGGLANEIQQVLDNNSLPSHIAEAIDAIRAIGNFAAHPMKSSASGEIVDVEPGEAEWILDVIESLFDFYFVQPSILAKKRQALNTKLQQTGKPPIK